MTPSVGSSRRTFSKNVSIPTIEPFLTDPAVHGTVAVATQNQAMHVLGYLDTRALTHAMEGRIKAVRADQQSRVPVVMTRDEVAAVLARMVGRREPYGITPSRGKARHVTTMPGKTDRHAAWRFQKLHTLG